MAAGIAGRVKKIKKLPFILLCKSSYLSYRRHLFKKTEITTARSSH